MSRFFYAVAVAGLLAAAFAFQTPAPPAAAGRVADPFATGWMLSDTNGDGIADFVQGKIVVPAQPTAAQNAAAANLAARVAYGSTGLTPPLVIAAASDAGDGPRIFVGKAVDGVVLEKEEGAVFAVEGNLAVFANDDAGFEAAGEAYSARAPYQWRVQGDRLSAIAAAVGENVELAGVTYLHGKSDVHRAFLRSTTAISAETLTKALADAHLAGVHELVVIGGVNAISSKPEPNAPPANPGGNGAGAGAGNGGTGAGADAAGGAAPAAPTRLDLATLYTSRGLFTAGGGRIPVPAASERPPLRARGRRRDRHGQPGRAHGPGNHRHHAADRVRRPTMRPRATCARRPCWPAIRRSRRRRRRNCAPHDTASAESETALAPGEGELRIVDNAFGRRAAVLARGDERGQAAALAALAGHFPNLWEQGKQHLSIEEIRYDLHQFFSLRSSVGQAAAALYHLDRWMTEAPAPAASKTSKPKSTPTSPIRKLARFRAPARFKTAARRRPM